MSSLASRSRPFRYAAAKPLKNDFYLNLKSVAAPSSTSHSLSASALWVALPYNKGGILPLPIDKSQWKAANDPAGISAHAGEVTDLQFSPFNDNILASSGSEGTAKIWQLPSDTFNLPATISNSNAKFEGGMENISTLKWHTTAENVLAFGHKNGVAIYDVERSSSPLFSFKIEGFGKDLISLGWSYNGSVLATLTKNGLINVFDPRSSDGAVLASSFAPLGLKKPQHVFFVNSDLTTNERLTVVGLTGSHRPVVQFYDFRSSLSSSSSPVLQQDLDFSQGYTLPMYDRDTGTLFFTVRGSNVISLYDIEPEKQAIGPSKQIMVAAHSASCEDVFKGAALINKRGVNSNEAEIQRIFLLGQETLQPYTVGVPRKVTGFHEELYPPTLDAKAAQSAEEWRSGANKEPNTISMAIINGRGPSASSSSASSSTSSTSSASSSSSSSSSLLAPSPSPTPDSGRASPASTSSAPAYTSTARKNLEAKLKKSPYTHVSMKEPQYKQYTFFDVKVGNTIALAENIQANSKWFAFPWRTISGNAIAVFPANQVGRAELNTPCIRGHPSAASAFDLSLQDENLLATGTPEGQIKVWRIPEEGLKKDLLEGQEENRMTTVGKIQVLKFHPFIPDILISAASSTDGHSIDVWDLREKSPASSKINLPNLHKDFIMDISFHPYGHAIATVCRDGRVRIIQLPHGKVLSEFTAVESIRDTRVVFTGPNRVITTGFGSGSIRSVSVWDISGREGKKLAQREIDRNSNTPIPRYDEDTGLLFIGNGGGSFLHLFEIKQEEPYVDLLSTFESVNEAMGFTILPKRASDIKIVEIAKAFKLTKDTVFPLSFPLARKRLEFFQDDVFPDSRDYSIPIFSADEFLSGRFPNGNEKYAKISLNKEGLKKLSEAPPEEMTEQQKRYQEQLKARNAPKAKGVLGHTSAEEVKHHFQSIAQNYSGKNRFDNAQEARNDDVNEDEWA